MPEDFENIGWERMKAMLDEHLPQEQEEEKRRRIIALPVWSMVAALFVLFFGLPLLIRENRIKKAVDTTTSATKITPPKQGANSNDVIINPLQGNNIYTIPAYTPNRTLRSNNHYITINKNGQNLELADNATSSLKDTTGKDQESFVVEDKTQLIADANTKQSDTAKQVIAAVPKSKTPAKTFPLLADATLPVTTKKEDNAAAFNLAVQVNRNMHNSNPNSNNVLYNLPVYPSLMASVNVSPKIGFSTGISVLSPGNLSQKGLNESKTEYTNNAQMMQPVLITQEIMQTYYWQIPFTVDFRIKKNLTLSGGASMAFLHKVLVNQRENNLAQGVPLISENTLSSNALFSARAADFNIIGQSYHVQKFDPRFLIGAHYKFNRLMIGMQFAQSLRNSVDFKNQPERDNKNRIFNVTLGFDLIK